MSLINCNVTTVYSLLSYQHSSDSFWGISYLGMTVWPSSLFILIHQHSIRCPCFIQLDNWYIQSTSSRLTTPIPPSKEGGLKSVAQSHCIGYPMVSPTIRFNRGIRELEGATVGVQTASQVLRGVKLTHG